MPAMPPSLTPELDRSIRQKIDELTSSSPPSIPGLLYCAVNRDGDLIFSHSSGHKGLGVPGEMDLETVFWLASCTKMITGIACMQLVEQGKLALDDADKIDRIAPELRDVQVLERFPEGTISLVPKRGRITLRMLLSHTAGFGYAFDHSILTDWARPIGVDDFSGNRHDVLHQPLVNQPGTTFAYGMSVDWAGTLVERVTNMTLEQYFQQYIFNPLGVRDISFFPDMSMKDRLAYMHRRDRDGTLKITDHFYRYPLLRNLGPESSARDDFCMGGAGCFGRPTEYCKIIAVLLNDGQCPKSGVRILKSETIQEMFTDQIPSMPIYCNGASSSAKPELANDCPVLPVADDVTEGWGLTFSLSHRTSPTGRAAGSASWEGLANLFWFADQENGIGGIIASQILPYGDRQVLECSDLVETMIYSGLQRQKVHL